MGLTNYSNSRGRHILPYSSMGFGILTLLKERSSQPHDYCLVLWKKLCEHANCFLQETRIDRGGIISAMQGLHIP